MTAASPARRAVVVGAVLAAASAMLFALGAAVGSTGVENLFDAHADAVAWQIVTEIRAPRTLGAWMAGALLGLAGAVAQGLFRNPLADPYLLGSGSGALLGVGLAMAAVGGTPFMLPWFARLGITGAAFVGAVGGVLLTLSLAQGVQHTLRLLLAGVVVGVVLGAVNSLNMLLSPEIMQALQAFMLGSTGFIGWGACALLAVPLAVCAAVAWALSPALDALTLGESTATSLGLPLPVMRMALVAVLGLATGAAVAQTGLIAFVGLAAPHLARSIVRPTHGALVLLAALMGGVLMLAADILARWVIAPQELPVGVLTAVLGGTYLLWLMRRRARAGEKGAL